MQTSLSEGFMGQGLPPPLGKNSFSQVPLRRPTHRRCCHSDGKLLAIGEIACLVWQKALCSVKMQRHKKPTPPPKFVAWVIPPLSPAAHRLMSGLTGWMVLEGLHWTDGWKTQLNPAQNNGQKHLL